MSGSNTYYTQGGGWTSLAPGVAIPGVTPAPAPQTYDQWGRPTGGLGNLYNAVGSAMQQQLPATTPNALGIGATGFGSSGYDQWGRQAPASQGGAGTAIPTLDPMSQSIVNAIASGQPQQGAMLAQILTGVPEDQVRRGVGGLLGAAAGGGGPGADQGAAGQGY